MRGESEGEQIVNFNTRVLGRKGVMEVKLVVDPDKLSATLPRFQCFGGDTANRFRRPSRSVTYLPCSTPIAIDCSHGSP